MLENANDLNNWDFVEGLKMNPNNPFKFSNN